MLPEIRALLKKIGIVGVEDEAQKLGPYAVESKDDPEDPSEESLEAAGKAVP
jgi:hypothetical protein